MSDGTPPTLPVALPPTHQWRFGRCVCCDRQRLVAPGPQILTEAGPVTLPFCVAGFERAGRYVHRVRLAAQMHADREAVSRSPGGTT